MDGGDGIEVNKEEMQCDVQNKKNKRGEVSWCMWPEEITCNMIWFRNGMTERSKLCVMKNIISNRSPPILHKQGCLSTSSMGNHLKPRLEGFVGSKDEQKTLFSSWLHLPQ